MSLARELIEQGHAVRGTTRAALRVEAIEAEGVEPFLGDPDRVATIAGAFEHVSVACVLLASATGPADRVQALHGTRLQMMLTKMLDTTVRGVVYEAVGSVAPSVLRSGAQLVDAACSDSHTPYALVDADPAAPEAWARAAAAAVAAVLQAA